MDTMPSGQHREVGLPLLLSYDLLIPSLGQEKGTQENECRDAADIFPVS
jgi:hypothetical protein